MLPLLEDSKLIKHHMVYYLAILEPKIFKGDILDFQRKIQCHGSISNVSCTIWIF